ncbi:MAG: HD-GYP domain-containing protein [Planctomycetes bacterium]|nr:HD-GYP domain-containing protein [Planctomycetota bacterium]
MLCFSGTLAPLDFIGIDNRRTVNRQRSAFAGAAELLTRTINMRDAYTAGHNARVTAYACLLAQHLDLSDTDRELIRVGTPLHDIGKVGIDDSILRKPSPLTAAEFEIMKSHTTKGAAILEPIGELTDLVAIVRSHHERWDGFGYPDRTVGDETPLLARVVAVADTFDAMTSDRPYRKGLDAEVAFAEIEKQSGRQFDPEIAFAFLSIKQRIVREMWSARD